ncbi:MAG: CGNR zinc finger domain-containing protein [bacterium]|nr:CGNR zinc finger domain-containing protein [bacterium]
MTWRETAKYHESKSGTRRWCGHKTCGKLMKVRRYRGRRKQSVR